jgi:hypothetical protein
LFTTKQRITSKSPKSAVCTRIIPRTGQFSTVSEPKPSHTFNASLWDAPWQDAATSSLHSPWMLVYDSTNGSDDPLRDLAQESEYSGFQFCCPMSASEAKTMKTKTWTVIKNTGKQADLESGLDKKEVQKPTHISASEFVHWLPPESHVDDASLRSLFKL